MMNNSLRGQRAKASGDLFENIISSKCLEYRISRIADIRKIAVEKRFKNGKVIYAEKSNIDYNGFLYLSGKHIAIEAKNVINGSSFGNRFVKPHQIEYLYDVYKAGGIALLIICFMSLNKVLVIELTDKAYNYFNSLLTNNKGKLVYAKYININKIENTFDHYYICSLLNIELLKLYNL